MKKIVFILCLLLVYSQAYAAEKWAEIYQSTVIAIHETPDNFIVVFSPRSFRFAVNVTNTNPQPIPKWTYDFLTQTFTPPVPEPENIITSKVFYLRLTGNEREAFIVSADGKVRQFAYWLSLSGDVDLTEQKVISGTNYLESIGIIGPGRADIILTVEIH